MKSIADMSVKELREEATRQNLSGRSEMNKDELVAALTDGSLEARVRRLEEQLEEVIGRLNLVAEQAAAARTAIPRLP